MRPQAHPAATARRTGGLPGLGAVPRQAGARPRHEPQGPRCGGAHYPGELRRVHPRVRGLRIL